MVAAGINSVKKAPSGRVRADLNDNIVDNSEQ